VLGEGKFALLEYVTIPPWRRVHADGVVVIAVFRVAFAVEPEATITRPVFGGPSNLDPNTAA
jgi:hypothetical protein